MDRSFALALDGIAYHRHVFNSKITGPSNCGSHDSSSDGILAFLKTLSEIRLWEDLKRPRLQFVSVKVLLRSTVPEFGILDQSVRKLSVQLSERIVETLFARLFSGCCFGETLLPSACPVAQTAYRAVWSASRRCPPNASLAQEDIYEPSYGWRHPAAAELERRCHSALDSGWRARIAESQGCG